MIFADGATMQRVFDTVVDRTRSRLDVPKIRTIFGTAQRPRRAARRAGTGPGAERVHRRRVRRQGALPHRRPVDACCVHAVASNAVIPSAGPIPCCARRAVAEPICSPGSAAARVAANPAI
jgi:hypothetical protein